jgi:hypothetical protein
MTVLRYAITCAFLSFSCIAVAFLFPFYLPCNRFEIALFLLSDRGVITTLSLQNHHAIAALSLRNQLAIAE